MVIRVDYLGLIVPGLFLAILGVLNQIEGHEKLQNLFDKEKRDYKFDLQSLFCVIIFRKFCII